MLYKSKKYSGIDIIKVLLAMMVVFAHTNPFHDNVAIQESIFINSIYRMIVPYFFISSGFLIFNKKQDELVNYSAVLNKTIFKYVKIYIIWTLIYLPITIYGYINNDRAFYIDFILFARSFFFRGDNFYSWPLWFLLCAIYSYIIMYFLVKNKLSEIKILFISIVIFSFGLLVHFLIKNIDTGPSYLANTTKILKFTFGSGNMFLGVLNISIGMLVARYKINLKNIYLLAIIGGSILAMFFSPTFIDDIMIFPIIFAIFIFSLKIETNNLKIEFIFRKTSSIIYFTHMIFFFLFTLIFKGFPYFGKDAFLVSLIGTIALSFFYFKFKDKLKVLNVIF